MLRFLTKLKSSALIDHQTWRCGNPKYSTSSRSTTPPNFGFDKMMLMILASCGVITIGDAYLEGTEHLKDSKLSSDAKHKSKAGAGSVAVGFALTAAHVRDLEYNGFVVIENVLSMAEVRDARADMACKEKQAKELHGPISLQEQVSYRNDNYVLIGRSDRNEVIARRTDPLVREEDEVGGGNGEAFLFVQMLLRGMGGQLQDAGFRGFDSQSNRTSLEKDKQVSEMRIPMSLQLSHYSPSKSFYQAHKDAAHWDPNQEGLLAYLRQYSYTKRYVTAILYLNNTAAPFVSWDARVDGGQLMLYPDAIASDVDTVVPVSSSRSSSSSSGLKKKGAPVSVNPCGGTLVLFSSHELLHEVMPTTRDRYALTCWFTA